MDEFLFHFDILESKLFHFKFFISLYKSENNISTVTVPKIQFSLVFRTMSHIQNRIKLLRLVYVRTTEVEIFGSESEKQLILRKGPLKICIVK